MSKIIFDRHLGQVLRKTLIKGNEKEATPQVIEEMIRLPITVSELLLRHEGICLSIYGENLFIGPLLKTFGLDGMLRLLESGAITFHLQSSMITSFVKDTKGLLPLQSAKLSSPTHSQADASVDDGMSRLISPPSGNKLKSLRKALIASYRSPSSDKTPTIVHLAHEGCKTGRFERFGISKQADPSTITSNERDKLSHLADELFLLSLVADLKMETLDELEVSSICDESISNLSSSKMLGKAELRIFDIENVPSLRDLLDRKVINPIEIPKLRENKDVRRFRRWLHTVSTSCDAKDVSRHYLDAITGQKNFFERPAGKVAKTVGVSALSSIIGAAVAGPLGGAVGGAVGAVGATAAPVALDIGIDLLDQFVLDGIVKGWQPRHYFERVIRPAISQAADREHLHDDATRGPKSE